ncbi:MAG: DNA-binding LytR/AlgR family response regulator [Shewanella psychromarinicola]|jgi:DNA-binding LytR/AlgR family response regulator|uniref:LytR/AlgR family response regulator transcription factor n=1 Tax=Shewanella psychromarinicola TaxID=2487742 RepID=UPI003EEBE768
MLYCIATSWLFRLKLVSPCRLICCLEQTERLSHDTAISDVTDIAIYDGKRNHSLSTNNICFIESMGRYQCVHITLYGKCRFNLDSILTEESMANFEHKLESKRFLRIHRSYIVNLAQVAQVVREPGRTLVKLFDVDSHYVARRKVVSLIECLRKSPIR